jgi:hypothetical protein
MPPERGDPRVCRAWPGVGTTFSRGSPGPTPWGGTGRGLGALGRVVGLAAGVQEGDIGGGGGAMGWLDKVLGEGEDRAANHGEPWEVGGISGRGIWVGGKPIGGQWRMG